MKYRAWQNVKLYWRKESSLRREPFQDHHRQDSRRPPYCSRKVRAGSSFRFLCYHLTGGITYFLTVCSCLNSETYTWLFCRPSSCISPWWAHDYGIWSHAFSILPSGTLDTGKLLHCTCTAPLSLSWTLFKLMESLPQGAKHWCMIRKQIIMEHQQGLVVSTRGIVIPCFSQELCFQGQQQNQVFISLFFFSCCCSHLVPFLKLGC